MSVITISATGFICAFSGTLAGCFAARASKNMSSRADGVLSSFTAGLLIAFICFKLLGEGFGASPFYIGATGLLSGAAAASALGFIMSARLKAPYQAPLITALAVMLLNFPEGIALGSLFAVSPNAGIQMAAIMSAHMIPETAAVFIPLKQTKSSLLPLCTALSLPMAAGCFAGALLSGFSGAFLSISLTFSAGVMIYVACGQMLPVAGKLAGSKLTTISAAAGFILGVVITA